MSFDWEKIRSKERSVKNRICMARIWCSNKWSGAVAILFLISSSVKYWLPSLWRLLQGCWWVISALWIWRGNYCSGAAAIHSLYYFIHSELFVLSFTAFLGMLVGLVLGKLKLRGQSRKMEVMLLNFCLVCLLVLQIEFCSGLFLLL